MHGLFVNKKKNDTGSTALVLKKIQSGDTKLKEEFIKDNVPYIIRTISNILGIVVDDRNSEEFSIGLAAFNEAIDRYDADKNGNFYTYSFVVIKSRLYDFIRRNRKHNNVLPFSYIEESTRVDERLLMSDASGQFEKIEVRQELVSFEKSLKEFGISLEDLVLSSPKHKDSRLLLIKIARIIADDDNMFRKLVEKKYIPMKEVLSRIKVNHKTIQRNRKFIIAVSLILRSNLYDLKEYVQGFEREESIMDNIGVIIKIEGNEAIVMTDDCSFKKVPIKDGMHPGQKILVPNNEVIQKENKSIKRISAVATGIAAVFLMVLSLIWINKPGRPDGIYAYIDVDINPSLNFLIDREGKVKALNPLNDDAQEIIRGVEFEDMFFSEALTQIIKISKAKGIIDENKTNYVLICAALDDNYNLQSDDKSRAQTEFEEFLDGIRKV